jgi:hypothetical protein
MALAGTVNAPKYANVMNGGIGVLGTGASTVGATALGTDGSAADAKVVYTAGAYGGNVESLMISTNDTVAVNVFVYAMDGATVHPIGIVNVPASSGNLGTVTSVDAINGTGICLNGLPMNQVYRKYIPLRANMTLKVSVLAAMSGNKILWAKSTGMDYSA